MGSLPRALQAIKDSAATVTDEVITVDGRAQGSSQKKNGQADGGNGLAGPLASHRGKKVLGKGTSRPSNGSMLGHGIQTWAWALSVSGQKE